MSQTTPEITGWERGSQKVLPSQGAEEEPTQLWLVAPSRAVQGEYAACLAPHIFTWFGRSRCWEPEVLQKGRDNWNQPLWRQSKGPSWLFSSPDGFWRFANNDLETWDMESRCRRG